MSKKSPKASGKFITYFEFWDALPKGGCPVCRQVERHSFLYLDGLLYERVNDPGTRAELRASLGFCNWHAWKALEVSNCALGLGILYEDFLERIEERLEKVQDAFPVRIPLRQRIFRRGQASRRHPPVRPKKGCPACQHARFFEMVLLQTLLDFISEPDFQRQFSLSSGICLSHLFEAMEKFPQHKNLPLLIRKQVEKIRSLRKEVAEFVRKQDYKYADEPRGREIDSWKRALEMIVGKREIFPSQMGREGRSEELTVEDKQKPKMNFPRGSAQAQGDADQVEGLKNRGKG